MKKGGGNHYGYTGYVNADGSYHPYNDRVCIAHMQDALVNTF